MGQNKKTEKKEKREREQKLVITMAKLRMGHAKTHGARKPPGPKISFLGNPEEGEKQCTYKKKGCVRFNPVIMAHKCNGACK